MEDTFKPELIGINHDGLTNETDAWERVIFDLNNLATHWKDFFNSTITIEKFEEALTTQDLEHFAQVTYIYSLNNELSRLAKKGQYKMDVLIAGTPFPPYDDLIAQIRDIRIFLKSKPEIKIDRQLEKLFKKGKFGLPKKIKEEITARHTFFTKNEMENLVLATIQEICNSINVFNNAGANITSRDLPRPLEACITTVKGTKKFSDIQGGHSGDPNHFLPKLIPFYGMFVNKNTLLRNVTLNNN